MTELTFNTLPFHVFKNLFCCSRSYYCSDLCSFCIRLSVKQKDSSDYINKKLFVPIDFFPSSIREGILLMDKVYFAFANKKIYSGYSNNFGVLYFECLNSPFILYKTYLELLCGIIYNNVDKKILPGFLSELKDDCRELSFCDHRNCIATNTKKNKVSFIVIKETFVSKLWIFAASILIRILSRIYDL